MYVNLFASVSLVNLLGNCFLVIRVFWSWNLDVVVFWSWDLDVVVYKSPSPHFQFIVKTERITQIYFNYIVEEYFSNPNLCNSYLHNVLEYQNIRIIRIVNRIL